MAMKHPASAPQGAQPAPHTARPKPPDEPAATDRTTAAPSAASTPGSTPSSTPSSTPKPPFTVAAGKSITSLRGILSEGDEVRPTYLIRVTDTESKAQALRHLEALLKLGVVDDHR